LAGHSRNLEENDVATRKRTVSVRLDAAAERRLELAARLVNQSRGAFLESAGETRAREVLLAWAATRFRRGEASLSELAEQTGLVVEEIVIALEDHGREIALEQFLASCRAVAETEDNPEFLRLGREVVAAVTATK
jgi:uncharacterized protein (DUF1778 family)